MREASHLAVARVSSVPDDERIKHADPPRATEPTH
jgi:hypothetical protein